jgi:DNA polymerase-3 subunit delta
MSALTRPQLERSLKEGNVRPLYLLIGVESYLRDQAARAIADEALRETLLREFNDSRFSLASGNVQEAIAAAEQLPMMSATRVVRITDFGKLREAEEEVLIHYLKRPAESSVVIFVADDLDKRKKLTKELLDKCAVVEFPAVKDGEARAWAKEHLRRLKVSADERVLGEIITLVGTDIQTLSSELEKLASAAAETGRITSEMVDDLIGRSRELSNFALGEQLIARNRKRAMETLHRLLEDGAEPVMLIGLIAGNYHRLAIAKDLLTRGERDEIFRVVRMPSFKQQEFVDTLQRSDASTIAGGIERIAAADLAIKTSQATPRLQLEMLVCELAGTK